MDFSVLTFVALYFLSGSGKVRGGEDLLDGSIPIICLLSFSDLANEEKLPMVEEYTGFSNLALHDIIFNDVRWFTDPICEARRLDDPHSLFRTPRYVPTNPSIVILHDTCASRSDKRVTYILKALFLRKFPFHYNIFLMDVPKFQCSSSFGKFFRKIFHKESRYEVTLKNLVDFFEVGIQKNYIQPHQINLIGMGLSAELAGEVAVALNKKINSIIGLDPYLENPFPHVKEDHAEIIQLYHCTQMSDPDSYKFNRRGRADFYFLIAVLSKIDRCAEAHGYDECLHKLCFDFFVGAILLSSRFQAWQCNSARSFRLQEEECHKKHTFISYPPKKGAHGLYYLRTTITFPFGVGADGWKFDRQTVYDNECDDGVGIAYDPSITLFGKPDGIKKKQGQKMVPQCVHEPVPDMYGKIRILGEEYGIFATEASEERENSGNQNY